MTEGKLIPNEQEAAAVRHIYSGYISGQTLAEIATTLNSRGISTKRGRAWTKQTVLNIVTNPLYAGYHRWLMFYWKGDHAPLVEAQKWNKAQKIKSYRSRKSESLLQVEELESGEFGIAAVA